MNGLTIFLVIDSLFKPIQQDVHFGIYVFKTSSLKASFLEIFSLILACSKIKSLKDGYLELEEL